MYAFKPLQKKVAQNTPSNTISTRFKTPEGYIRLATTTPSFSNYLQNFELKPTTTKVHYYNGAEKPNKVAAAVLNLDVGNKDLQQCADAVMRLRAEYLYKNNLYNSIRFNFTNGFNAEYKKWRQGNRISVKGNNVSWVSTSKESTSYQSFREYLNIVFTYAGTASLAKELKSVPLAEMQIGDVLIRGGSPGHAVIVVDMAVNTKTKQKLFMVAQSYMPAQDIHVLLNTGNTTISPWYILHENDATINTPEWIFSANELKRF